MTTLYEMHIKLWDTDHPYYCTEGCYYKNGHHNDYESFDEFLDEWDDADLDLNLISRWDWWEGEENEIEEGKTQLRIYYMMQRKAFPHSICIDVTRDDEPRIREWLAVRAAHMAKLWEPFLSPASLATQP